MSTTSNIIIAIISIIVVTLIIYFAFFKNSKKSLGQSCDNKNVCNDGLTCSNNICLASLNQQCILSTDCTTGLCSNNVCKSQSGSTCSNNTDCSMGQICDRSSGFGFCQITGRNSGEVGSFCNITSLWPPTNNSTSVGCKQGLVCNSGICAMATTASDKSINSTCNTDNDCGLNLMCINSLCQVNSVDPHICKYTGSIGNETCQNNTIVGNTYHTCTANSHCTSGQCLGAPQIYVFDLSLNQWKVHSSPPSGVVFDRLSACMYKNEDQLIGIVRQPERDLSKSISGIYVYIDNIGINKDVNKNAYSIPPQGLNANFTPIININNNVNNNIDSHYWKLLVEGQFRSKVTMGKNNETAELELVDAVQTPGSILAVYRIIVSYSSKPIGTAIYSITTNKKGKLNITPYNPVTVNGSHLPLGVPYTVDKKPLYITEIDVNNEMDIVITAYSQGIKDMYIKRSNNPYFALAKISSTFLNLPRFGYNNTIGINNGTKYIITDLDDNVTKAYPVETANIIDADLGKERLEDSLFIANVPTTKQYSIYTINKGIMTKLTGYVDKFSRLSVGKERYLLTTSSCT